MNKCKKCGTEFEGKFCPQCGTPWLEEGEKICPKCKAVLKASAKFCSECGYSFETQSAPAPVVPQPAPVVPQPAPVAPKPRLAHTGNGLLAAYKIVSVLPEVLFLLFGVLAFIFLAAPVTKISSVGLFLGAVDVGSGYHVVSLSGVGGLRSPAVGFIVFAALGAAFALLYALSAWRRKKSTPLSYGFFIFYLVYLIIASVMISNTASLDEGLGVLSAGACPICFLVFSIVFAAGQAASMVARNILNKNSEVKAARAAKEEAEKARREEFYATHKEPVMKAPPTKKNAVIYKYEKRYYNRGKEKTPSAALVFLDLHKVALGIAAVALTIAIVLMATLIPYANNKFRIGVVRKISLGDDKERVADVLGEPYGEDRTSNDWFYYDKGLLSYVEKGQNLSKEQEEAIAQGNFTRAEQLAQEAKNLQEQMKSMAFKCIEVTFADNKVESVLFDTRYSLEPKAKEVGNYELLGDVLVGYYEDRTVSPTKYQSVGGTNTAAPYEVRFTDGSYYKTYVKNGTMEITSKNYYTTEYTFLWNDKYGSYSDEITEKETVKIGTVDKDGAWSANGEGIKKLKLSKAVLPDSVTSIKDLSLSSYENLTYNQYGNALYIGSSANPYFILMKAENKTVTECQINAGAQIIYDGAFQNCTALTGISIPNGVISIGENAFSGCSGLTGISIADSVTSIGRDAFKDCNNIERATMPTTAISSIPKGNLKRMVLTSGDAIGDYAFRNCAALESVIIPDSVTSIGSYAFRGCSGLTSVAIGSGVISIGSSAFAGTAYYNDETKWNQDGVLYNNHCLLGAKDTLSGEYTIEEEVLAIAMDAFSACINLESLSVSDDNPNYSYQDGILYNKAKTKIIAVPKGIKGAVTIPAGVAELSSVFTDCIGLESITLDTNNRNYSSQDGILYNKAKTKIIAVPKGIKGAVTIPDGVTSIWEEEFYNCSGLVSIEIPNSVTLIRSDAFKGCSGLESVMVAEGNPCYSSQDGILYNEAKTYIIQVPQGIKGAVTIPNGVIEIEFDEFKGRSGLESITIPDSVTKIKSGAFYNCSGLKSVTIGSGVTEIDIVAFGYCDGLESITVAAENQKYSSQDGILYDKAKTYIIQVPQGIKGAVTIPNGVIEIEFGEFKGRSGLESITIPDSVTEIEHEAFYNCSGLKSVTIGEGVTKIGTYAFCGCSGLTSVTIPDSVTEIGNEAFYNCSGLKSVTIGSGVTEIEWYAFAGCSELTDIQFKGTVAKWKAIYKGVHLDHDTGEYTVTCTDGTVKKDGTVTYFNN